MVRMSMTMAGRRQDDRRPMNAPSLRSAGVVGLLAGLLLGACGGPPPGAAGADPTRLRIVTTVAPVTSIVAAVAGDRADIRGIVPEGTNSHTFEPPPRAAEELARADLVVMNGLRLEEPIRKLAGAVTREGTGLLELGPAAIDESRWVYDFSFPKEEGRPNPHLWTDPQFARRYGELVRDALIERDPAGAGTYGRNYDAFAAAVGELDRGMRAAFATLPRDRRKLVTYHDAYAYFARDYDWTVIGAIQVADFGDPTAREVAALVEQVRAEDVKAIFGSEVFPSPVLEQIGRETGVRYVDVLRDDDLPGEPGTAEHSLLGLLRFDYVTMTAALGGDASALEALDLTVTAPDQAVYPQ
jgi:ABC-type Zn uptake system ZnuABC Zn-binding protein ZnuA